MTGPRTLTIPLPTLTVQALSWGPDEGPLALLLHGFPDSPSTWRHLGPELAARGSRVVAPYLRGYAPTGPAPDGNYQAGALIADVIAIHHALGGDERAILIGHDWGGLIANGVAAHAPHLFSAVVLLAAPPPAAIIALLTRPHPRHLTVVARQAPRSWYAAVVSIPALADLVGERLIRTLWRRWAPDHDHTDDLSSALRALPDRTHRQAAFTYYRAVWNPRHRAAAYAREQSAAYQPSRVPTLYLHGAIDRCALAELGEAALTILPPGSRRVVVHDAGHFLHLEKPAETTTEIVRFVHHTQPSAR
ncbi:Pimeloyl-ACP methyl ester carboxylesterase [Actinokineospora alba]|uniref:Pimeloyl-ACP methyl ester carboxylesterase n=1 Tax=Actinokineospora alba TaxID=504798 RepID=A0A1H0FAT7_9PSEU|nr:alpha/beta hydrolase [Actinokineospora alba]TDP69407.1 pimeloyl-ACP methyl ester carboxylesterase [Actinokineospora alba]SDI17379.1 Pimeloyl-ACP methyl ester carboxylesterase [Actinokineospora alba]SDN91735.1 Pimeloyl-ACP methyl ester carboxylesterase [Actinokineospora alba]